MAIKLNFDSFIHAVDIVNRTAKGTVQDMKEVADSVGEEIQNMDPQAYRASGHELGSRLNAAFRSAQERVPDFQKMVEERVPTAPIEAIRGFVDGLNGRPLNP